MPPNHPKVKAGYFFNGMNKKKHSKNIIVAGNLSSTPVEIHPEVYVVMTFVKADQAAQPISVCVTCVVILIFYDSDEFDTDAIQHRFAVPAVRLRSKLQLQCTWNCIAVNPLMLRQTQTFSFGSFMFFC